MGPVVTRRRFVLAGGALASPSAAQVPEIAPTVQAFIENRCSTEQHVAFASYPTPDTLLVQGWTVVPFMGSATATLYAGRPVFHYAYLERSFQETVGDLGVGSAELTLLPTNPEGNFAYQVPADAVREVPGVSRRYRAGRAAITVSTLRRPTLYRVVDSITAHRHTAESAGDREARMWRAARPFLTEGFARMRGKSLLLRCS